MFQLQLSVFFGMCPPVAVEGDSWLQATPTFLDPAGHCYGVG